MATLGNLFMNLGVNTANFQEGLKNAERQLSSSRASMNRQLSRLQKNFGGLTRSAGRFASSVAEIGTVATAAGVGVAFLVDRTLNSVQQLERLSNTTGITVKRLQELRFAFSASGGKRDVFNDAIQEMTQRMGEAAAQGGEMAEGFKLAGFSIDRLKDRRPAGVFEELVRVLRDAETEQRALNIAARTFGDEGARQIVAFARDSNRSLEELTKQFRESGAAMNEEMVRGASAAANQLDELKRIIVGHFTKAIAKLGPDIREFTSELVENPGKVKSFAEDVTTLASAMGTLASKTASAVGELIDFGEGLGKAAAHAAGFGATTMTNELQRRIEKTRAEIHDIKMGFDEEVGFGPFSISKGPILNSLLGPSDEEKQRLETLQGRLETLKKSLKEVQRQAGDGGTATGSIKPIQVPDFPVESPGGPPGSDSGRDFSGPRGVVRDPDDIDVSGIAGRVSRNIARGGVGVNTRGTPGERRAPMAGIGKLSEAQKQAQKEMNKTEEVFKNSAQRIDDVFTNVGRSIEDQFIKIKETGKAQIGDLFDAIANQAIRAAVQQSITGPLFGAGASGGGLFGKALGSFFGGGKAEGGPVSSNKAFLVGERGPELFKPDQSGEIVPNKGIGKGGGTKVEVNIIGGSGNESVREEQTPQGPRIDIELDRQMAQKVRDPGSDTHRAITQSTTAESSMSP